MAESTKYFLRMNNFEEKSKFVVKQLQIGKFFCDLTLSCEDKQIETHKVIVSFFSPILKNILKQNQSSEIYLANVDFRHLQNLINFMYQGEVTVANEDLSSFLDIAHALQVKGLSGRNKKENNLAEDVSQNAVTSVKSEKNLTAEKVKHNNILQTTTTLSEVKNELKINEEYNDSFPPKKEMEDKAIKQDKKENIVSICGPKQLICKVCEKVFIKRSSLQGHIQSVHEGRRYPCSQCDYMATQMGSLNVHVKTIHEGVRYSCDLCDHKATSVSNLYRHIKHAHGEV